MISRLLPLKVNGKKSGSLCSDIIFRVHLKILIIRLVKWKIIKFLAKSERVTLVWYTWLGGLQTTSEWH